MAIIERLPVLAKSLGPVAFDAKLTGSVLVWPEQCFAYAHFNLTATKAWLLDNVYAIRESAIQHLQKIVQVIVCFVQSVESYCDCRFSVLAGPKSPSSPRLFKWDLSADILLV